MKAIVTKYVGPTNTKPSRIVAKAEGVKSVTVSYDHSLNVADNHKAAALALCNRMGWTGDMASGGMPEADSYCHCFIPAEFQQAKQAVFETRLAMRDGLNNGNPWCRKYGRVVGALTDIDIGAGVWAGEFEAFAATSGEVAA